MVLVFPLTATLDPEEGPEEVTHQLGGRSSCIVIGSDSGPDPGPVSRKNNSLFFSLSWYLPGSVNIWSPLCEGKGGFPMEPTGWG